MYKLAANYQKYRYDAGGQMDMSTGRVNSAMGIPMAASGVVDSIYQPDQYGAKPIGASVASGALKGASMGASMGAVAGPIGAGVGAAAGAIAGAAYGYFSGKAGNRRAERMQSEMTRARDQQNGARSAAAISADPSLVYGHQFGSNYAMGGQIETAGGTTLTPGQRKGTRSRPLAENYLSRFTKADGGSLSPMSSDTVAINGPAHEQGGVDLPGSNAEVEGGETMKGDFVFSDRLGFADEHKRLARAIGKVQDKGVMTPEKVNAIHRMQGREQTLALSQEFFKHIASGGQLPDPTQQPQIQQP